MKRIGIILVGLLLSVVGFAQTLDCQQQQCLAVVDAGSSGSRLHIYTYDLDLNNTPINISEKWSKKVLPGFADLANNQALVDAYLTTLFTGAPAQPMPLYFYSTAGMRLLPQPKQKQLYNNLQQWFTGQSQWQLNQVKTITGREEGLYGWLAVNYQLGTLTDTEKTPVGVMDMGGASVQVSFPATKYGNFNAEDILQVSLYGRQFSVFVHSFLGLGQTALSYQFLANPACFPNDYQLPEGSLGKGDAIVCEKSVASLINNVHQVNQLVPAALAVNPVSQWYALGGLGFLKKNKPFNFENTPFTPEAILSQAESSVCKTSWPALSVNFPNNDFLFSYCLQPAYYYALMVEGYGLSATEEVNVMAANQNADWTIGVVLLNAPSEVAPSI